MKPLLQRLSLPRRLTLASVAAASVALLGAGLLTTGRDRAFMPGRLIQAHRKLEFQCRACHRSGGGGPDEFNDGCAAPNCHAKALDTNAQGSDDCTKCHKSHPGRAFRPTCGQCHRDKVGTGGKKPPSKAKPVVRDRFNHTQHAKKAPPGTACTACHHRSDDQRSFSLPTHGDCRECHDHAEECPAIDDAPKQRGKKCVRCHLTPKYQGKGDPAPSLFAYVVFSHARHSHEACDECHRAVDAVRRRPDRFVMSMQACQDCHNDPKRSEDRAPRDCMACHRSHHRYGRFAEAQIARGMIPFRNEWVTRDQAEGIFSDQTSRAMSNLKGGDPETAAIHFDLAKQIAKATSKSKWSGHPIAAKMKRRVAQIAEEFETGKEPKTPEETQKAELDAVAQRRLKLRAATRGPKEHYLAVSDTYALKVEKAIEKLDLEGQLAKVDGSAKARYAGVTVRIEVFWSLWELRDAAERDALSVVRAIFQGVPDVQEAMVEVESKLSDNLGEQQWDRVLHITATRESHQNLNYRRLTLADAQAAFTFQYDPRVKKAQPAAED